jgi:hypothetical protein
VAEPAGDCLKGALGQWERLCNPAVTGRLPCSQKRSEYLQRDPAVAITELSSLLFAQAKALVAARDDIRKDLLEGRRRRHLGDTAGRDYYV